MSKAPGMGESPVPQGQKPARPSFAEATEKVPPSHLIRTTVLPPIHSNPQFSQPFRHPGSQRQFGEDSSGGPPESIMNLTERK